MHDVSTLRLYLLRATYLLIGIGMGAQIWPLLLGGGPAPAHMQGVVRAMLGALTLLVLLGVRYPLQMLPLLLFEFAWKTIWVVAIGLPLWRANAFDAGTRETWVACLMGVVLCPLVIPWGYVARNYLLKAGDRWGLRREGARGSAQPVR